MSGTVLPSYHRLNPRSMEYPTVSTRDNTRMTPNSGRGRRSTVFVIAILLMTTATPSWGMALESNPTDASHTGERSTVDGVFPEIAHAPPLDNNNSSNHPESLSGSHPTPQAIPHQDTDRVDDAKTHEGEGMTETEGEEGVPMKQSEDEGGNGSEGGSKLPPPDPDSNENNTQTESRPTPGGGTSPVEDAPDIEISGIIGIKDEQVAPEIEEETPRAANDERETIDDEELGEEEEEAEGDPVSPDELDGSDNPSGKNDSVNLEDDEEDTDPEETNDRAEDSTTTEKTEEPHRGSEGFLQDDPKAARDGGDTEDVGEAIQAGGGTAEGSGDEGAPEGVSGEEENDNQNADDGENSEVVAPDLKYEPADAKEITEVPPPLPESEENSNADESGDPEVPENLVNGVLSNDLTREMDDESQRAGVDKKDVDEEEINQGEVSSEVHSRDAEEDTEGENVVDVENNTKEETKEKEDTNIRSGTEPKETENSAETKNLDRGSEEEHAKRIEPTDGTNAPPSGSSETNESEKSDRGEKGSERDPSLFTQGIDPRTDGGAISDQGPDPESNVPNDGKGVPPEERFVNDNAPSNDEEGANPVIREGMFKLTPDFMTREKEEASLAFIFDTTGSMHDDLVQARDGAITIVETFLKQEIIPVSNYILVPFNDPVVEPIVVTDNPEEFIKVLNEVKIHGGGDCPEMSCRGILEALKRAHPNSYLYVFSDAPSKDYFLYEEILDAVQRKHSQVNFFLSGLCRGREIKPEAYSVYNKIASASDGQVFLMTKEDIKSAMDFLRDTMRARGITVYSVNRPTPLVGKPHTEDFNVTVEKDLEKLTVTITGNQPTVEVSNPSGETPKDLKKVLDLPNVVVVNVDDPKPAGTWNVNVTIQPKDPDLVSNTIPDGFTLQAKGTGGTYQIRHGFSIKDAEGLDETAKRPLEGTENYLVIEIHPVTNDPEKIAWLRKYNWSYVDFLKMDGGMLWSLPLRPIVRDVDEDESQPIKFIAGPFSPLSDLFKLSFNGVDGDGNPVSRLSNNAISSHAAAPPLVTMPEHKTGFRGQNLTMNCRVESLLPFKLEWYKNGELYHGNLTYEQSANARLTIENVKKEDEGYYECLATNKRGTMLSSNGTTVTITDPPVIQDSNTPKVIAPVNKDILLDCEVKSDMNYSVKWTHEHGGNIVQISPENMNERFQLLENNSLLITSVEKDDSGLYKCIATSLAGTGEKEIEVKVVLPPEITTTPENDFHFLEGETLHMECKSVGPTAANISWEFNEMSMEPYTESMDEFSKTIEIPNANNQWEGKYVCVAVNEAGKTHKEVKGFYAVPPITKPTTNQHIALKEGEGAIMTCLVSGDPQPTVKWLHNEHPIPEGGNYEISSDGLSLKLHGISPEEEGVYKCEATGVRGTKSSTDFEVRIGTEPKPGIRPKDSILSRGSEGWFPCSAENQADANVFPKMAVITTWKRDNGVPLDLVRHEVLDSGTLHIIDADISDEGIYICTLENDFGKINLEMELQLTGFTPPLITGISEPKLSIPEGKSLILNCTILSDSDYEVQWIHHHDGRQEEVPLGQDDRIQKLENNSLLFSSLKEIDSGKYICRASNRAGETNKEIELSVIVPPSISTSPEGSFEFLRGETINMSCTTDDDTMSNVSWEFNGIGMKALTKSINASSKSLIIPFADKEWNGTYMCIAVNEAGKVHKEIQGIYVEPPEVHPENQYVAVKPGEVAEMRCSVNGSSQPAMIWYHKGVQLHNSDKYEISNEGTILKIFGSDAKDEGSYECVAEGPKGTKSSKPIEMIIGMPPRPKLPNPYVSLKLGEEGSFLCAGEHDPNAELFPGMETLVTWRRKDEDLDPERHIVLPSGALHISEATTSDDGVYVCTLENDYGKVDLEMDLEIIGLVPPMIIPDDDEHRHYLSGENVTLWCNSSGQPSPILSWFFKGDGMSNWRRIAEENNESANISIADEKLSIFNADYGNQGQYSCTAENEAGFAEKIFQLNMKAPPVLMDNGGPVDISLVEGESFSLSCTAKGVPDPTVKWIKDGVELPRVSFDGSYRIMEGGLGLEISKAKTGMSDGFYKCLAENEAGKVEKSYKVKVLVPPAHGNSYFESQAVNLQVKVGDPFTITCPIANGLAIPVPNYGWAKNGKILHTEQVITSENGRSPGHLQINENGKTLYIDGAMLDDAGNYSCIGYNKAGRMISHAAEVEVFIPPKHSPGSQNITTHEVLRGDNVTFNCSVVGIPKPKIVWTKDGKYLSENQPDVKFDYTMRDGNELLAQLTIADVQGYHSGMYQCLTYNHIGKSSLAFDLNVLVPPIAVGPENRVLDIIEGESAVLNCSIKGNPKPTITWHKLNKGQDEKLRKNRIANPSALELTNIHPEESGIYVCSGTNSIGSTKMSFNVSVLVAPALGEASPEVEVVTIGDNITLKCNPSGSPSPSISWFKNGYLIGNSFDDEKELHHGNSLFISKDGRDIRLENITKDDDGTYSCVSYNKAGKVERTFLVETVEKASASVFSGEVSSPLNGSTVSFDCSATGRPAPKVQWTRLPATDGLTTTQKSEYQPMVNNDGETAISVQLVFEKVNPHNSAIYMCKAENKAGRAVKTFHLDVHVPPSVEGHIGDENGDSSRIGIVKKQPGSLTVQVVAGRTLTLSCKVLSGRPTPRLMWLRDGKKVLKNIHQPQNPYRYFLEDTSSVAAHGVFLIDSDETLVISNITEEESGPYKCMASNVAGTSEVNFDVEVFVPPSLEEGVNLETEYAVKVHSFISLICPVTGNPMPDIKWFKDSEEIDEEFANIYQMSQDKHRLVIMQAKVENAGEYTCVATNQAGTRKINYKISVLDEHSEWSPWGSWSACSSSCGTGLRKRYRECTLIQPNPKQLVPSYYRTSENQVEIVKQGSCPGEGVQVQKCTLEPCLKSDSLEYQPRPNKKKTKRVPKRASLNLQGRLNGKKLNPRTASANYDPWNNGPTLEAEVGVDPYQQGNLHPYLPFILSPITWSTAGEIDDARNGYSLTDGIFEQRSQLEFMSGETLHLSHKGQGVDGKTGELKVNIEVTGEVPQYQSDSLIYLEPYVENYVQTSPSSLYAWTESDMTVDGQRVPYRWNSSLHYDSTLGTMGYLVEQLSLDDLNTYNDYENHKIVYSASPKISKKYNENRCPDGFNPDEDNLHCIDIDECRDNLQKCHESQTCKNEMGSYNCLCPQGFTLKTVGHPCVDINECSAGQNPCSHECKNTVGSFYCTCPKGMEIRSDKYYCEKQSGVLPDQGKTKLPMLDLLPDYHIVPLMTPKPPARLWSSKNKNLSANQTPGSGNDETNQRWLDHEDYQRCPNGYESVNGVCQDIDECLNHHRTPRLRQYNQKTSPCPLPSQQCINTNGSYHCIEMSCPIGFDEVDVDFSDKSDSLVYCLQLCDTNGFPCQDKAEIAQIVVNSIITISGMKPRHSLLQFSVPITARNSHNETKTLASTTRTTFQKLNDDTGSSNKQILQLFRVRSEGTAGVLYSMKDFSVPGIYRVAVMATTYNGYSHHVLYSTKFVVNIYVTGQ